MYKNRYKYYGEQEVYQIILIHKMTDKDREI